MVIILMSGNGEHILGESILIFYINSALRFIEVMSSFSLIHHLH